MGRTGKIICVKNAFLNFLLVMLFSQARLQARQDKTGDRRHHYKGLSYDAILLYLVYQEVIIVEFYT